MRTAYWPLIGFLASIGSTSIPSNNYRPYPTIENTIQTPAVSTNLHSQQMLRTTKEELFSRPNTTAHLPPSNLLEFLTPHANEDEFEVAYLPDEQLVVNISLERSVQRVQSDRQLLEQLLESKNNILLIHNHNNRELDPARGELNALYWLAPSELDLAQMFIIGAQHPHARYGIVTHYGLLTMSTDPDTYRCIDHPMFRCMISAEALHLQQSLRGVTEDALTKWAQEYRGIVRLGFQELKKDK